MPLLSLQEIEKTVTDLAARIDAPSYLLPKFGETQRFFGTSIQISAGFYEFALVEYGKENHRVRTLDIQELLYRVFDFVTEDLATDWELENRKKDEDWRRQFFQKRVELMTLVEPKFGERMQAEIDEGLKTYPFKS